MSELLKHIVSDETSSSRKGALAFLLLLNFWSILEDEVILSKNIFRNGYIHTQGADSVIANDK